MLTEVRDRKERSAFYLHQQQYTNAYESRIATSVDQMPGTLTNRVSPVKRTHTNGIAANYFNLSL